MMSSPSSRSSRSSHRSLDHSFGQLTKNLLPQVELSELSIEPLFPEALRNVPYAEFVERVISREPQIKTLPRFVFGHSMGGLISILTGLVSCPPLPFFDVTAGFASKP